MSKTPIDFDVSPSGRVWIGEKCIAFFIQEVRRFFVSAFKQLKWPIEGQSKCLKER